jgi:hypothetical protein
VDARFQPLEDPSAWGNRQPKFERLECEGAGREAPARYFLIGSLASGEQIRVQLVSASYQQGRSE